MLAVSRRLASSVSLNEKHLFLPLVRFEHFHWMKTTTRGTAHKPITTSMMYMATAILELSCVTFANAHSVVLTKQINIPKTCSHIAWYSVLYNNKQAYISRVWIATQLEADSVDARVTDRCSVRSQHGFAPDRRRRKDLPWTLRRERCLQHKDWIEDK